MRGTRWRKLGEAGTERDRRGGESLMMEAQRETMWRTLREGGTQKTMCRKLREAQRRQCGEQEVQRELDDCGERIGERGERGRRCGEKVARNGVGAAGNGRELGPPALRRHSSEKASSGHGGGAAGGRRLQTVQENRTRSLQVINHQQDQRRQPCNDNGRAVEARRRCDRGSRMQFGGAVGGWGSG